ncbi:sensor histidine kinase [Jeotgalibacillus sp. R-1-5s-1]|uniref:sensor histidine kinase n=1 Tax=Jeotgalibacillus sp. R-1-5s-1 TaxID=2555897 RepID=UPI00106D9549|nr:sensor histidine kinase [Jeotgalibacillus sp. R-1-5s-1]TFE01199.1 sensor histidine kinase [Jeotgalibacillus sp. R-1-5s-1]
MMAKNTFQAVGLSVLTVLLTFGVYLLMFPPEQWGSLWQETILDIPIVLFLVLQLLLVSMIWGLIQGHGYKRQVMMVQRQLDDLLLGRATSEGSLPKTAELSKLSEKASELQALWTEQVLTSQKLASEKVEQQEQKIQEMVSQERQRLARELHDSVSQQLFAASMLMSAINEEESARENRQLQMVEKMIQQSQIEMRALLLHLRPAALKGKTLAEGIEELLTELQLKVPLKLTWKAEPLELERSVEDHLFRILQESISNTLRHAEAEILSVLCILRDDYVILRITDDGKGFTISEDKAGSYGLASMRERAAEIGGKLKIVSLPDQGTRLEIKVPFKRREEAE